jgi:nucleotide-binding universal stress UspA family protein
VAQHVVEYACCPVLIVRAPYHSFCKVLFATDGSMASQSAALYLGNFPLADNVDVRLMHVLPPMQIPVMMEPYIGGGWQTVYAVPRTVQEEEALRERETKLGEALLTRSRCLLQKSGLDATPVLARGDAATEILDYARENQIDLLVAGSRGLGQFQSLWMGSVSRKLVHYSNCSVLIVKEPGKE